MNLLPESDNHQNTFSSVVVLGSTSYIARHFIKLLSSKAESNVYEFSRGSDPELFAQETRGPALAALLSDLKPSLITNFVGVVNETPDQCMEWNCYFPRDILRAAVSSSPKAKILLIGSAAEYGLRDNPTPIPENSPLLGTTPYALSKIAQHKLLEQPEFAQLSILYARVFNVWGMGMGANTLPGSLFDQLSKASSQPRELRIRDSNSVRDFISVEKVCSLFYEALTVLQNPTYLNFASGLPMTVGDFSLRMINAVSTQIAENTALEVSSAPTYSVADVSRLNSFLFDILKVDR